MEDLSGCSLAELRSMAQGCTELTCMYHGAINAEIRTRSPIPSNCSCIGGPHGGYTCEACR